MEKPNPLWDAFSRWAATQALPAEDVARTYEIAEAADRWIVEHRNASLVWAGPRDIKAYLFGAAAPSASARNEIVAALRVFERFLKDEGFSNETPAADLPDLAGAPSTTDKIKADLDRILREFDPATDEHVLALRPILGDDDWQFVCDYFRDDIEKGVLLGLVGAAAWSVLREWGVQNRGRFFEQIRGVRECWGDYDAEANQRLEVIVDREPSVERILYGLHDAAEERAYGTLDLVLDDIQAG